MSQEQASQESRAAGGRVRRHSTSSPNSFLGKLVGSLPLALDRSSIQEWSTTSKLAQKAIQRSDSMHSRMAQLVLRARQHGVRRKRRGSMELITTRGPGSFVGGLCVGPGAKPQHSKSAVVARGPVTLLLIRSEKVRRGAVHRGKWIFCRRQATAPRALPGRTCRRLWAGSTAAGAVP